MRNMEYLKGLPQPVKVRVRVEYLLVLEEFLTTKVMGSIVRKTFKISINTAMLAAKWAPATHPALTLTFTSQK